MNDATLTSRDKLVRDLRVVLADAEELFKATANETGERIKAARARLEAHLEAARARIADLEQGARAAAEETDRFARENPWKTAGIAAGVGFLIGVLIGRNL